MDKYYLIIYNDHYRVGYPSVAEDTDRGDQKLRLCWKEAPGGRVICFSGEEEHVYALPSPNEASGIEKSLPPLKPTLAKERTHEWNKRFATHIPFSSGEFTAPQPDSPPPPANAPPPAIPAPGADWKRAYAAPISPADEVEVMFNDGHYRTGLAGEFDWNYVCWWRKI